MKRLLIAAVLTLTAAAAFARSADNVLVTPDGTVFKVDQATPSSSSAIDAASFLSLSIQRGNNDPEYMAVPDSLKSGYHSGGSLAYDPETKTLFVLWVHAPNAMSSELLLAAYRDGKWQKAISFENEPYHIKSHLQLETTRRVSRLQKDGTYADAPALLLHALWWDEAGTSEEARYALLTVDKGEASVAEVHSLEEFVTDDADATANVDGPFNKDLLRHPSIVSSPSQSSVDVVFGDTTTNTIHTTRFTPIADARVHIPVGIGGGNPGGGGRGIRGPHGLTTGDWSGAVTVLAHGDNLIFATTSDAGVNYIMFADGKWSDVKSVATGAKLSTEAAIAAIDRMLTAQ